MLVRRRRGFGKGRVSEKNLLDSSVDQSSGDVAIEFRKPMVILERKLSTAHLMRCWSYY